MIIAHISDSHILAPDSDHPAAEARADCLRRAVADINRQQPDAVIFTGDTVQYGQPEEYARLHALLAPLEAPLYLIPGNRDDNSTLRTAFADRGYLPEEGGFLHYTVEDHPLRLVAIDSTLSGERMGVFCPARAAWLDATLRQQPERPTLLFIHHPPFDIGDHYVGGYRRPGEAAALGDVVSRHAQVRGLLCGHVHRLTETSWSGTSARVMTSIAADVRIDIDSAGETPVYLLHDVSEENGLVSRAREIGG